MDIVEGEVGLQKRFDTQRDHGYMVERILNFALTLTNLGSSPLRAEEGVVDRC